MLIISIIITVIIAEVLRDVLNIDITVSVGTSRRFIAELKAASRAQKKNRPPKAIP